MHRHRLAFSICCLLLTACGHDAAFYLNTGNKSYQSGRYDEAALNYRKAIQKNANSAEAYLGLGRTLAQQHKSDSIAALKKAVALAPANTEAKELLTSIALSAYLTDSRHPKVLYDLLGTLASEYLAKDPNSYNGLRLKGHLALTDRKLTEAAAFFRKANLAKPMQPDVVLGLAKTLLPDAQTAPEGEQLLAELIRKHPDLGPAYDLLFSQYASTNRPVEAEKLLNAKVASNPRQASFFEQLAEFYRRTGKPEQMTATLQTMLDRPKDFPRAHLEVGDYYNRTGNPEKALAQYEEGARTPGPDQLAYRQRTVGALAALGRSEQALALAEQTLQDHPQDPELRGARAVLLLHNRKLDPALAQLEKLVSENKDEPTLHFQFGRALILKGDVTRGRNELREAVRLGKRYLEPRMALASLAIDTGQFDQAQSEVTEILAISPENPGALVLRAAALRGLGRYPESRAVLTDLQRRFPKAPGLDVELGFLSLYEKKFADAEQAFRTRYQLGQENLRVLVGLTQSLEAQKRNAEAAGILEAELAQIPNRPPVEFLLAGLYRRSGDTEQAIRVLEQLTAAHPEIALAHQRLGDLHLRKGDIDRALFSLAKARDLDPTNTESLLLLGYAQMQARHFEDAKQNYRAVLKLDAANLEALNNLAFLTADTGGDLAEALALATGASQKAPTQPDIADTMGFVYLKMRKHENALQVFRNLAKKYPANPTFRYHHALALLETGDRSAAKGELHAALADQPTDLLGAKIKEALRRTD